MLIQEIGYKFEQDEFYTLLPIRAMSGSISLQGAPSRAGFIEQAECTAYIPYLSAEMDLIMFKLAQLGGIFYIRDSANLYHELGNSAVKAQLKYNRLNPGSPGAKYGYDITIAFASPVGIPVQSFTGSAS